MPTPLAPWWFVAATLALLTPRAVCQVFGGELLQTGAGTSFVKLGDLNGDGIPDVVVARTQTASHVTAFLSSGGAFARSSDTAVPPHPLSFAVVDLDNDGALDFATADFLSSSVSIGRGDGLGGFAAVASFTSGSLPSALRVADFDGDGLLDVVVSRYASTPPMVAVLRNLGGGSLAAPVESLTAAVAPTDLDAGDVNTDGKPDLVTAEHASTSSGLSSILAGSGSGAFAIVNTQPIVPYPLAVLGGDFSGDGKRDAAYGASAGGQFNGGTLETRAGDGTGAFTSMGLYTIPGNAAKLDYADVSGDGLADFLIADNSAHALHVLTGNGAGSFAAPKPYATVTGVGAISIADVNGDGALDVAAVSGVLEAVYFHVNAGAHGFEGPKHYSTLANPREVAAGDLDHDGDLDVVVGGPNSNALAVFAGTGATGVVAAPGTAAGGTGVRALALADVNGDGHLDILAGSSGPGKFSISTGDGQLGFSPPVDFGGGTSTSALALRDVDLDGVLDVLVASDGATGKGVRPYLGDGAGGFVAQAFYADDQFPSDLDTGDLDADGLPDFAASGASGQLTVRLGAGMGAFGPALTTPISGSPSAVGLCDLDGDGRIDASVGLGQVKSVAVFRGAGGGLFQSPASLPVAGRAFALRFGDADRDGRQDLIAALDTGALAVALAAPGALPVPASLHFTGSVTRGLALGDLDGDGLLDAVAVNEFGPGLTLLTSVSPLPAGIVPFGAGTGGCQGTLGILGNSPPAIGNAGFAVTATNAPASSLGLLLIGDAVSLFGFDPFSLGVQLHVDPYLSMFLVGLDIWSDASGGAHLTVPIPGNPLLTGFGYFAQALFLESPAGGGVCTPSPFGLVASRGLSIVLQP